MANLPEARAERPDGRAERSKRTRQAVIDALLALIRDGDPNPGAREVAERAGVSTRTVFAHFASLEDLHRASVQRVTGMVLSLLTRIDPAEPLAARVDSLSRQRARVNEEIGPMRRAAALQAASSAALSEARERGRRASVAQLERVFARELGGLDDATRRRRVGTIDAVLSGDAWDLLRGTHGLSYDAARLAVGEAVRTLLGDASPPLELAAALPAKDDDGPRVRAAERALADLEQRIERLVAAIEAGSPANILAPRLETLHEERRAAETELAGARGGGPISGLDPALGP